MTSDLIKHVRVLSEACDSRMIGTPGNHAAASYIAEVFENAGLAVERQTFSCPAWQALDVCLSIEGRPYPTFANTFSPSCDISGRLLPLSTFSELKVALNAGQLGGSIAVLYGELMQGPLSPKKFFIADENHLKIIAALEQGGPRAVITVHPTLGMRARLIEDTDFSLPSVTVPLEVGLELVRRGGEVAYLKIDTQTHPDGFTENVIARLPGLGGAPARRVVICAHYDTKPDTPGALDNACGVAVLLGLAARLNRTAPLPVDLEFVAFSNEEFYSGPETDVYFQTTGPTFGQIAVAINIDGIGSAVSATNLATFEGGPEFEAAVEGVRAGFPGIYRTEPWPASNHYLFFSNGVPTIALSSGGLNYIVVHHTPNDTIRWVGENKLEECAQLVERLVAVLGV